MPGDIFSWQEKLGSAWDVLGMLLLGSDSLVKAVVLTNYTNVKFILKLVKSVDHYNLLNRVFTSDTFLFLI